jgi:hypothetical protein
MATRMVQSYSIRDGAVMQMRARIFRETRAMRAVAPGLCHSRPVRLGRP